MTAPTKSAAPVKRVAANTPPAPGEKSPGGQFDFKEFTEQPEDVTLGDDPDSGSGVVFGAVEAVERGHDVEDYLALINDGETHADAIESLDTQVYLNLGFSSSRIESLLTVREITPALFADAEKVAGLTPYQYLTLRLFEPEECSPELVATHADALDAADHANERLYGIQPEYAEGRFYGLTHRSALAMVVRNNEDGPVAVSKNQALRLAHAGIVKAVRDQNRIIENLLVAKKVVAIRERLSKTVAAAGRLQESKIILEQLTEQRSRVDQYGAKLVEAREREADARAVYDFQLDLAREKRNPAAS